MVESGLAKLRGVLGAARAFVAAIATDRTAVLQRGVRIRCEGCDRNTLAMQQTRASRHGVWRGDPTAPDGWSIRYRRRDGQDALATYYCADCAAKVATGEIKV